MDVKNAERSQRRSISDPQFNELRVDRKCKTKPITQDAQLVVPRIGGSKQYEGTNPINVRFCPGKTGQNRTFEHRNVRNEANDNPGKMSSDATFDRGRILGTNPIALTGSAAWPLLVMCVCYAPFN